MEKRESRDLKTESSWGFSGSIFDSDYRKENPPSGEQVNLALSRG